MKLEDLVVAYGQSTIIRGINLEVPENELVCLMGRNGVGKTTTLKTIVGLLRPKSGVIAMDGRQLDRLTTSERARSGIAYVPQGRDIFPGLTVWENLQISIVVKGKAARAQVDRVFELFPALKGMLKRKGGVLSGGEQQQLAIGRALLLDPKLLILDEPTEGIQPSIIDQIEDTLLALKAEKRMSILLVEQYVEFALAVSDHFCIMERGRIVKAGEISQLDEKTVADHLTV
ncbi:MAG: urea ABC transporter ATP-binding subunit UrtE [Verrucomicrobiales bacterium]